MFRATPATGGRVFPLPTSTQAQPRPPTFLDSFPMSASTASARGGTESEFTKLAASAARCAERSLYRPRRLWLLWTWGLRLSGALRVTHSALLRAVRLSVWVHCGAGGLGPTGEIAARTRTALGGVGKCCRAIRVGWPGSTGSWFLLRGTAVGAGQAGATPTAAASPCLGHGRRCSQGNAACKNGACDSVHVRASARSGLKTPIERLRRGNQVGTWRGSMSEKAHRLRLMRVPALLVDAGNR